MEQPLVDVATTFSMGQTISQRKGRHFFHVVTGLFLSNENTIGPAIDLLALVLREASRDRR